MKRKLITILCIAAALCMLSVSAFGAGAVDMERKGSISITMRYQGEIVPGGSLTIYRVARVTEDDGNYGFALVEEFADCGISIDDLSGSNPAQDLADYAAENLIQGTMELIDDNGFVKFTDLEVGLYLLVQEDAAEDFRPASPFLVSVPGNKNGEYVYDVDGSPKLSLILAPTEETQPPETTEPKPTDPKVPQTGQTNWPVPVLAVSGVLIFLLGWYLRRSGRKDFYED